MLCPYDKARTWAPTIMMIQHMWTLVSQFKEDTLADQFTKIFFSHNIRFLEYFSAKINPNFSQFRSIGTKMPLDTKVRIKPAMMSWTVLVLLSLLCCQASGSAPKCNKRPLGQQSYKTWGDNGFKVSVVGSPRLYRPGQVYTVSLSGERMDEGDLEPKKVKFIDFMVVAESNLPSTEVRDD